MNLNEFAKEVHALAVEKGFYDQQPTDSEMIAAIHTEISEAFEEWRAGRPMVYYKCHLDTICNGDCKHDADTCVYKDNHPEGIAVELIDVVLRILDAAETWGVTPDDIHPKPESFTDAICETMKDVPISVLVNVLHILVSRIDNAHTYYIKQPALMETIAYPLFLAIEWVRAQGLDPEALMLEKHRYNQTRPYRHGGKRI